MLSRLPLRATTHLPSDGSEEIIILKKNTLKSKMNSLAYKYKDEGGDLGLEEDKEEE